MTEVVALETVGGMRSKTQEAHSAMRRWRRTWGGHLNLHEKAEALCDETHTVGVEYETTLRLLLKRLGIEVVGIPEIPHLALVERAVSRRKPCDEKGDGYRDALNWLTVLAFANQLSDQEVYWISSNIKDFANSDQSDFHPDLKADLEGIGATDRVCWRSDVATWRWN